MSAVAIIEAEADVTWVMTQVENSLGDVVGEFTDEKMAAAECWDLAIDAARRRLGPGDEAIRCAREACARCGYPPAGYRKTLRRTSVKPEADVADFVNDLEHAMDDPPEKVVKPTGVHRGGYSLGDIARRAVDEAIEDDFERVADETDNQVHWRERAIERGLIAVNQILASKDPNKLTAFINLFYNPSEDARDHLYNYQDRPGLEAAVEELTGIADGTLTLDEAEPTDQDRDDIERVLDAASTPEALKNRLYDMVRKRYHSAVPADIRDEVETWLGDFMELVTNTMADMKPEELEDMLNVYEQLGESTEVDKFEQVADKYDNTIGKRERQTHSVRFAKEVFKESDPDLLTHADKSMGGESMWVEEVGQVGILKFGRLKNTSFVYPLEFNDWVIYGDIGAEYRPVAVYCLTGDHTRAVVVGIARENLDVFERALRNETKRTRAAQACARCGADHALRGPNGRVWMVNDEAWAKVPKKYQRKILCQRCFTNLTGLDPEDPSIKRLTRG